MGASGSHDVPLFAINGRDGRLFYEDTEFNLKGVNWFGSEAYNGTDDSRATWVRDSIEPMCSAGAQPSGGGRAKHPFRMVMIFRRAVTFRRSVGDTGCMTDALPDDQMKADLFARISRSARRARQTHH